MPKKQAQNLRIRAASLLPGKSMTLSPCCPAGARARTAQGPPAHLFMLSVSSLGGVWHLMAAVAKVRDGNSQISSGLLAHFLDLNMSMISTSSWMGGRTEWLVVTWRREKV